MGTNGKVISNVEELEALDNNYVLGKAGSVSSWGSGVAPQWFLDSIGDAISVEGVRSGELLDSLRGIVRTLEVGVNQSITEINTDILSSNSIVASAVSRLAGNESAILNLEHTSVTKTEARALSLDVMSTEFATPGSVANTWVVDSTQSISDAVQATNETLNLLSSEFAVSDGTKASAENLNTSFTTSGLAPDGTLQAGAGEFGQLRAMVNGIGLTLTTEGGILIGIPTPWKTGMALRIGMTREKSTGPSGVFEQYLGGAFGRLQDGWVPYNGSILGLIDKEKGAREAHVNGVKKSLQDQLDGSISTWFSLYNTPYTAALADHVSTAMAVTLAPYDTVWNGTGMYSYLGRVETGVNLSLETYPLAGRWRSITNLAPSPSNHPANLWVSYADRLSHVGDIVYNTYNGKAYRFIYQDVLDSPDHGVIFSWVLITDVDLVKALADAANAKDTADGKRTIFYRDSVPISSTASTGATLPIRTGDMWIPSKEVRYKGYIYKVGEMYIFVEGNTPYEWIRANGYTNAINTVNNDLIKFTANITKQVDRKIETFLQSTEPIGRTVGAVNDTPGIPDLRRKYIGDLWKRNTTRTNAAGIVVIVSREHRYDIVAGSFKWIKAEIPDILFDAYDGKKTVFTNDNISTIEDAVEGDMWIPGITHGTYEKAKLYVYNGTGWGTGLDYVDQKTASAEVKLFTGNTINNVITNVVPNGVVPSEGDILTSNNEVYSDADTPPTFARTSGTGGNYPIVFRRTNDVWIHKSKNWIDENAIQWVGGASKLLRGPDGSITGWSFSDGSNRKSTFMVNADNFRIMGGNDEARWKQSFGIAAGAGPGGANMISFNGIVDFTNSTMDDYENSALTTSIATAQTKANAAHTLAGDAVAVNSTQATTIGQISLDNVVDGGEKIALRRVKAQIAKEYPKLIVQASDARDSDFGGVSISTTTYTGAYNALNTYLVNTVVITGTTATTITRATMTTKFDNYYTAEEALRGAITAKLKDNLTSLKNAWGNTDDYTQINGSVIKTGKIQSHDGNTYFKLGSATEAAQIKMSNGAGFTLDSTATGDSPNIEGAYIKGATMIATTLSVRDLKMLTDRGQETASILYSDVTVSNNNLSTVLEFDIFATNSLSLSKNKLGKTHGTRVHFSGMNSITLRNRLHNYGGWIVLATIRIPPVGILDNATFDGINFLNFEVLIGNGRMFILKDVPLSREVTIAGITVFLYHARFGNYILFMKPVNILGWMYGQGRLRIHLILDTGWTMSAYGLGMTVYNL